MSLMPARLAQLRKALADWGPDSVALRLAEILHSLSSVTVAAEHALFVVPPDCRRPCLQKIFPSL